MYIFLKLYNLIKSLAVFPVSNIVNVDKGHLTLTYTVKHTLLSYLWKVLAAARYFLKGYY